MIFNIIILLSIYLSIYLYIYDWHVDFSQAVTLSENRPRPGKILELPAGRGRPCLWLFFVRAEWLGTVRNLLTNPKAFQTQANQHVNFRNFGFVGAVWPKFSKISANRFILCRVLISWETSYLTNKKNPKSIRRPDLSLFGFPRCDFRVITDYYDYYDYPWHVDFF